MKKNVRVLMKSAAGDVDVTSLAHAALWTLHSTTDETSTQPSQIIWITEDGESVVRVIDDFKIGVPYIYIESKKPKRIVEQIRNFVDVYTPKELWELAKKAKTAEDHDKAVRHLALIAPPDYDPKFFEFFRKCLLYPEPSVQRAAILAMGYVGWKELGPVLQELVAEASARDVKRLAKIALEGFAKHGFSN